MVFFLNLLQILCQTVGETIAELKEIRAEEMAYPVVLYRVLVSFW
jgi:hypothetical protein